MRKKAICAIISVLALFCGTVGTASALSAATGLTCDVTSDPAVLNWDDVDGADKYSVDFRCEMEVDEVTTTVEFDIGTSDGEDVGPISDSELTVTHQELNDAALMDLSGYQCFAKVKGLNPGNNRGKQNHTFSSPSVDCGVVAAP